MLNYILGCMGCFNLFGLGPVLPAFAFAFAILIAVQSMGGISPSHLNPSITIGFLILGEMNWKRCLVYVFSQYVGALLGFGALWVKYSNYFALNRWNYLQISYVGTVKRSRLS